MRRFKIRNGTELNFTTMGLGMGPIGEIFEVLDEKTTISTVEQAYRGLAAEPAGHEVHGTGF